MFAFNEKGAFRAATQPAPAVIAPFEVAVKLGRAGAAGEINAGAASRRTARNGNRRAVPLRQRSRHGPRGAARAHSGQRRRTGLRPTPRRSTRTTSENSASFAAGACRYRDGSARRRRSRGSMANYQHKDWWTRPHFDPDPARLPERTSPSYGGPRAVIITCCRSSVLPFAPTPPA